MLPLHPYSFSDSDGVAMEDGDKILNIGLAALLLSAISDIFLIVAYYRLPRRKQLSSTSSLRPEWFVFHLSLNGLLFSFVFLIGKVYSPTNFDTIPSDFCKAQGMLLMYLADSAVALICMLHYALLQMVRRRDELRKTGTEDKDVERLIQIKGFLRRTKMQTVFLAYVLPFIMVFLPLTSHSYGYAGDGWCWVIGDGASSGWRFLVHAPVILGAAYVLYTAFNTWREAKDQARAEHEPVSLLVLFYGIIFAVTWTPFIIVRLLQFWDVHVSVELRAATAFILFLGGFLNAIVYGADTSPVTELLQKTWPTILYRFPSQDAIGGSVPGLDQTPDAALFPPGALANPLSFFANLPPNAVLQKIDQWPEDIAVNQPIVMGAPVEHDASNSQFLTFGARVVIGVVCVLFSGVMCFIQSLFNVVLLLHHNLIQSDDNKPPRHQLLGAAFLVLFDFGFCISIVTCLVGATSNAVNFNAGTFGGDIYQPYQPVAIYLILFAIILITYYFRGSTEPAADNHASQLSQPMDAENPVTQAEEWLRAQKVEIAKLRVKRSKLLWWAAVVCGGLLCSSSVINNQRHKKCDNVDSVYGQFFEAGYAISVFAAVTHITVYLGSIVLVYRESVEMLERIRSGTNLPRANAPRARRVQQAADGYVEVEQRKLDLSADGPHRDFETFDQIITQFLNQNSMQGSTEIRSIVTLICCFLFIDVCLLILNTLHIARTLAPHSFAFSVLTNGMFVIISSFFFTISVRAQLFSIDLEGLKGDIKRQIFTISQRIHQHPAGEARDIQLRKTEVSLESFHFHFLKIPSGAFVTFAFAAWAYSVVSFFVLVIRASYISHC